MLFRSEGVRVRPLVKTMTPEYIRQQFAVYPHPVLAPIAKSAVHLPMILRTAKFPTMMGELVAHAKRSV